jgi:hypothetical protein
MILTGIFIRNKLLKIFYYFIIRNKMLELFQCSTMNPTFIFIDGSYYCFYRYYALMNWWRNAYPDEKLEDPYQNTKFVDKFKKTFNVFLCIINS